jgi:DNA-binding NarL/FixJ family response regulator
MIKILIVDDRASVREGLRMALSLETDILVVGEAENGEEAINAVPRLSPDVVILDVEMPIMDGLTAAQEIQKQYPHIAIILLSIHEYSTEFSPPMISGLTAFVEKQGDPKVLVDRIRQLYSQTNIG